MKSRLLMFLFAASCAGCSSVDMTKFPDPHGHRIAVHFQESSTYHVDDMTANDPGRLSLQKPDERAVIFNPARTLAAVMSATPHQFYGYPVPALVMLRDGKPFLCFVSKTWPNRPFGDIAWLDNRLLTFDLVAGESMGWHYVVDAEAGRAIFATPFNDADQRSSRP